MCCSTRVSHWHKESGSIFPQQKEGLEEKHIVRLLCRNVISSCSCGEYTTKIRFIRQNERFWTTIINTMVSAD